MISFRDISDEEVRQWFIKHKLKVDKNLHNYHQDLYPIETNRYPTVLEIESTSRCNVEPPCPMCMRVHRNKEDEFDMPEYITEWLTNPISSVQSISISGIGEPMMSSSFDRTLELCGHKAEINFFSNGQILTKSNINNVLNKTINHIDFSLDAATSETYMKIRGYDLTTFDKVLKNIKSLVDEKINRKLTHPTIHFIMVIMKENYKELPLLVDLANDIGVDGVRYWRMRKPSSKTDYKNTIRKGFSFSYEEQSQIPDDLTSVIITSRRLAKKYHLVFEEN